MNKITEKLKNNWRKLVSAIFILLMFTMPATRGILSKIFNLNVYASNNNDKNKNKNNTPTKSSVSVKSVSAPVSHNAVSPMAQSGKVSGNNKDSNKKGSDKVKGK